MNNVGNGFAVLVDPTELLLLYPDWPARICLAICLQPFGSCQILVYRQEEAELMPSRIQRALSSSVHEVCIVPETAGYPTRTLSYTDEQRLKELIAETPEIVDQAIDYDVNYTFAVDEGLDPATFLDATNPPTTINGPSPDQIQQLVIDKEESCTELVERGELPKFLRQRFGVILGGPGPEYRSVKQIEIDECRDDNAVIHAEEAGWIVVDRRSTRGSELRVIDPGDVFLRNDQKVLAVTKTKPQVRDNILPSRLRIRSSNLPSTVRSFLSKKQGGAKLSADDGFVYVHFEVA